MLSVAIEQITETLRGMVDPDTEHNLVLSKSARNIRVDGGEMPLDMELGYPAKSQFEPIRKLVIGTPRQVQGVENVSVQVSMKIVTHAVQRGVYLMPSVKNIIAMVSDKGGVGKSTTAVNLALVLVAEGVNISIPGADIYGPSQPTMLGIQGQSESVDGKTMESMEEHDLQANSIGFLIEQDNLMIRRGPVVTSALEQLLKQTNWRDLDYLIVDMPSGTGDIQLTLSQKVSMMGAVIVATPQGIALLDAKKGLKMFEKVGVLIIGVVENMAVHCCPNCGHAEHVFGAGGGERMCEQYGVLSLDSLSLNLSIREQADSGHPTVVADPDGAIASVCKQIACHVVTAMAEKAKDMTNEFLSIVVQNT